MNNTAQTTSLIEIRDFLKIHQNAPAPWETPKGVVDRLYSTLSAKREDPAFWTDLKNLVDRLEDRRFDRLAFEGAMAFQGATLSRLLDELRATLGRGGNGGSGVRGDSGIKRWANRSLTMAALFSFLLLGTAVGCNGVKSDGSGDAEAGSVGDVNGYPPGVGDVSGNPPCQEAVNEGLGGHAGEVYCDLVEIIKTADIPNEMKQELLGCLPELDAEYREELLDMFENMTDEEIADYLEDPYEFCNEPTSPDDDDDH